MIERNFGRGPGVVLLMLRASKTWAFGNRGETAGGPGGIMKAGPPPSPGGGPMVVMMGGPGGPAKKYNLTLGVNAQYVLNHPNFAAPVGDLSSPFFGQSLGLAGGFGSGGAGAATYNRKIDVNLRFGF